MRRQRNFNFNPHNIFIANQQKLINTYISALITLSQGISKLGLESASGLRILRSRYTEELEAYFANPTKTTYYFFLAELKNLQNQWLKSATAIKVTDLQTHLDTHFMFHVYLDNPLTNQRLVDSIKPEIQFVRTQRRYNKRRYSRVRAVSRPSFWSGAMLSTTATAMFWGSSLTGIDWISVSPVILDINPIIFCLYFIVIYKFLKLNVRSTINDSREKNKQRRGFIDVFWFQLTGHFKW